MPKIKTLPLLESIFKTKGGTSDLWKAINNLINKRENEIPVFCNYIKHKINGYDKQNSLLALDFIDFCVDNGNMSLWSQLNSKDFLSSLITNLKTREDLEIQSKILFLIEKWAKKFYNYPELSNFQNVYGLLRKNNVQFPTDIESNYHNYVKQKSYVFNKNDDGDDDDDSDNNNDNDNDYTSNNSNKIKNLNNIKKKETDPETYLRDINLDLNTSSYEKKYKRLVNKLYDWTHDIHEINVLINKNIEGINNNKIEGLIKDLSYGIRQLVETIQSGRLKDENLMNIALNVKSDIDMTLRRWSNYKKGISPNPFISSFLQNDDSAQINDNNSNNMNYYNNNYNHYNNYNDKTENKINNTIDIKDFFNVKNNSTYINANKDIKNINNNNNNGNNNKNSFNLLFDFDSIPISNNQSNNNFNNNFNFNLNNRNNMNNQFDFVSKSENPNQFYNINNINIEKNDYNINNINNSNNNNFNYNNNNNNNMMDFKNKMNFSNSFNNSINNNNLESNNDNPIRQSLMYPTFEELDQD